MNRFRFIIPNFFTSLSLIFALGSLNYIAKDEFILASWFIFLSMVFDFLDGKLARRLNATSPFGAMFDTMSDFVAFGVVPGLLMYRVSLVQLNMFGFIVMIIYVFCGCYRLIRFAQRTNDPNKKTAFIGLPIPIAAGFLSSTVLINITVWGKHPDVYPLVLISLILSFLMVSRIEYLTVNEKGKFSMGTKIVFFLALVSIVVFFKHSHFILSFWILSYIIFNPLRYLTLKVIKKPFQSHN